MAGWPCSARCGTPTGRVKRRIYVTKKLPLPVCIVGSHVWNVGPMFVKWVQYMYRKYFSPTVEIGKRSRELRCFCKKKAHICVGEGDLPFPTPFTNGEIWSDIPVNSRSDTSRKQPIKCVKNMYMYILCLLIFHP